MNGSAIRHANKVRELAEGQTIPVQILFELHMTTPEATPDMAILALPLSSRFTATLALPDNGHIGHICEMPNRIAEWRKARQLSYKGLADLVGCDPKTIERLEKGYRRLTVDWMSRVAAALGVDSKDLLPLGQHVQNGSEEMRPERRSHSKDILMGLIDNMTEEEAQKALQIINLAKEFNRKSESSRDSDDGSENNSTRLAG